MISLEVRDLQAIALLTSLSERAISTVRAGRIAHAAERLWGLLEEAVYC
jgi:hypothetical protein